MKILYFCGSSSVAQRGQGYGSRKWFRRVPSVSKICTLPTEPDMTVEYNMRK